VQEEPRKSAQSLKKSGDPRRPKERGQKNTKASVARVSSFVWEREKDEGV